MAAVLTPAVILVYSAGFVLGLALVIFPSAGTIFTDPSQFAFSRGEYGSVFIPQMVFAILGAILGPQLAQKRGLKFVFISGMICMAFAMVCISMAPLFLHAHPLAYATVLLTNTFLGAGFGLVLPMLNRYAQGFFPQKSAVAITALHSLMGIGTSCTPILIVVLVKNLVWWVLPIATAIVFIFLIFIAVSQPLVIATERGASQIPPAKARLPKEFWIFMAIGLLYGFCETIFSNWAIPYLTMEKFLDGETASFALSSFWIMLTVGRIIIAFMSVKWPFSVFYRGLPFLLFLALLNVPFVHDANAAIIAFGFAGFACSAFFPLTFSFAQDWFVERAEMVSGALMASYMLGYGFASFGIGQALEVSDIAISGIYRASSVLALFVLILAIALTRKYPRLAELKTAG